MILVVGFLVALVCLALQALALVVAARYFAHAAERPLGSRPVATVFRRFAVLMVVLLLGNVVQIGIWGVLYWILKAFEDFETALYFSGVTFTTLGYGDVVLKGHYGRLLAPVQAANGVMMFGVTTAAFFAAIQQMLQLRPQLAAAPDVTRTGPSHGSRA
jgi:hypothetical protein